jgi:hypothetical protein
MCRAGGAPAGEGPKLAHARLWLWETLTGGLPSKHPHSFVLTIPNSSPATPASRVASPHRQRDGSRSTPAGCSTPTAAATSRSPGHLVTWSPDGEGIALRYVVRHHPSEDARPASTAPSRVRLAALLTPEELRELVNQGNSLRGIAARYGISRKTIHDELVAHDIPIRPRDRHQRAIDRDWLHEQYVTTRRTTAEIARASG